MKADDRSGTIADGRLCSWPKVRRDGNGVKLKFRVLTPLRLSLIEELVFAPFTAIWRILAFIYVINLILYHLRWVNLFPYLPFSQCISLTGERFEVSEDVPILFCVKNGAITFPRMR